MEKELLKTVDDMMSSPGVVGVLCADKQGMCLISQGTANPKYAGSLTSLTQLASTIEPGKGDPVIMFEGQENQCMLHRDEGVTVTVYKKKSP